MLKFVHQRFVLARPDLACTSAARRGCWRRWSRRCSRGSLDPDEAARLPPRLHDLVELGRGRTDRRSAHRTRTRRRARGRAIVDFVAALTDGQAVGLLDALSGRSGQLWTDAFVL